MRLIKYICNYLSFLGASLLLTSVFFFSRCLKRVYRFMLLATYLSEEAGEEKSILTGLAALSTSIFTMLEVVIEFAELETVFFVFS